ncbi:MAG: hypothetical protein GY870_04295 [archaeon]|nr:hypothetical protein [archaeon]
MSDFFFRIISGNFELIELIIYSIIHVCVLFLFLFLAYKRYPKENKYSIKTHAISFLGSTRKDQNVDGWYFFTLGFCIFGMMDIPLALYFYGKIKIIDSNLSHIAFLLNLFALISLIIAGIFPSSDNKTIGMIHLLSGIFTLSGYALVLVYRAALLFHENAKEIISQVNNISPLFYIFYLIALSALYNGLRFLKRHRKDETYSYPWLYEWLLFIADVFLINFTNIVIY